MSALLAALSLGLVLAQYQPSLPPRAVPCAALAALACLGVGLSMLHARPARRPRAVHGRLLVGVLGVTLALGGYAWGTQAALERLAGRLADADSDRPRVIEAWVADLPQSGSGGTRLLLDVLAGARSPGQPARLSVTLPAPLAAAAVPLRAGDCARFSLRLRPVHSLLNFAGFDGEAWMWAAGIQATGIVTGVAACTHWTAGPAAWLQNLRDGIRRRLQSEIGGQPAAGILVALAVGDQTGVAQQQWRVLWRSGVGHLVSISGVHVTLLAGLLRALV